LARNLRGNSSKTAALTLDFLNRTAVFETLRAYGGKIFRGQEHLSRLSESCAALGRELPLGKKSIKLWLEASLRKSGFPDATLRLSVHWRSRAQGELVLFVREFQPHPSAWYEKGVALRTAVGRRPTLKAQDPQIKSSQYVCSVLALLDHPGVTQELLFLGPLGTVAEGSVSNIFIVKEKSLLTPSVGSGILKGVTRGFVMDLARKRGYTVRECPLTRHEIYTAEECFVTNTSSEVLPVVRVDERVIGSGWPGPVTQKLAKDFKENR
jgi:branched-chain amino acid aminotransferase